MSPTQQQRNLDLLTITSPSKNTATSHCQFTIPFVYDLIDNLTVQGKKHHMVFVTARVHPGESPASLVCQGLCNMCGEYIRFVMCCMCFTIVSNLAIEYVIPESQQ